MIDEAASHRLGYPRVNCPTRSTWIERAPFSLPAELRQASLNQPSATFSCLLLGRAVVVTTGSSKRSLGSIDRGADPIPRLCPEVRAGGFTRYDHRIIFFARVNALLRDDMTVLDFGAGRGIWAEIESGFELQLTTLRGSAGTSSALILIRQFWGIPLSTRRSFCRPMDVSRSSRSAIPWSHW
jgi:hypothetical protein